MISFMNPLHRDREVSSFSPPKTPHSLLRQHLQHQQDQLHPDEASSRRISSDKPRYYSIFSELTTQVDQRERALQQFPCEERHSYNPHYQHNLVSSPTYSSPPSLCPSSAGSSPSSAYSSGSSTSSLSRATGPRILNQEQSNKQDHHYYRHYNRRQNRRYNTYQQQNEHFHDDWMFGISEDDGYNGDTSMACAQPQDPLGGYSSLSTMPSLNGSLRSSISRRDRPQVANGSLSVTSSAAQNSTKNRRPTVTFSPIVLHHPAASQESPIQLSSSNSTSPASSSASAKLMPSISESTAFTVGLNSSSMAMATAKTDSTIVQRQQHQSASAGRMTAQQSLMRIAHLSKDQDGWCSSKAGQYTQGYAEARTRGMKIDGRRTRHL
ncbi:hypothetical protein FBU30_002192 [Linnemannia zychae]|nr:hypothetical protein FBU30_002192 [Linnemannia zychae]